ncbi:hypothetical protein ACIBF6_17180 [Streptosporangium amethystogenes]
MERGKVAQAVPAGTDGTEVVATSISTSRPHVMVTADASSSYAKDLPWT